jgi:hypothetical protein
MTIAPADTMIRAAWDGHAHKVVEPIHPMSQRGDPS